MYNSEGFRVRYTNTINVKELIYKCGVLKNSRIKIKNLVEISRELFECSLEQRISPTVKAYVSNSRLVLCKTSVVRESKTAVRPSVEIVIIVRVKVG